MFKNYLKMSIRNLKKHKAYSTLNILGLAMGMVCSILILLWVQDELSFDRFHENSDNLYRITVRNDDNVSSWSPWALINVLTSEYPEVERGSWYMRRDVDTRYKDKIFMESIALVTPDFLKMFTFPQIKGDLNTALSNINSIILTEETAERYFGKEDPIGKIINIQKRKNLMVTGVIKNVPTNSHIQFEMLARPEVFVTKERMQTWNMDCASYVSLSKGVDYKQVENKISEVVNIKDKDSVAKFYVGLQPLEEIHLRSLNGTDDMVYVYVFSLIALMVLLIACVNFMNLSTARSVLRAKEIGMRKVVGGKRSDLIKQFFSETFVLSFLSLLIALFIVFLFLPIFNTLAEKQITMSFMGNFEIVSGLILIALLTGLISGTYPALYLSSFKPISVLQISKNKGSKSYYLRRGLIIFQFIVVVVLIIFSSVILKQMNFIKKMDLGYNRENIISIYMDPELTGKYEVLKNELLANKNIINVTAAYNSPLYIGNTERVKWKGLEQHKLAKFTVADYDYFETFNMKMKYGRSFSKEHAGGETQYIINETLLKMTGYKEPIGKMFTRWKDQGIIVGVVKDFNGSSLRREVLPTFFFLNNGWLKRNLYIKVNSSNIPSSIEFIRTSIKNIHPGFLFEYSFMNDQFNNMYTNERILHELLSYFTFLAIFISCLGLLGLASFMAEQKTKEIAIRKVLGAKTFSIIAKLSREFTILVLLANVIAWPIAQYLATAWLNEFIYRIGIGLGIFILSAIIALFIALFTVSYKTYKAATANPINSLKYE